MEQNNIEVIGISRDDDHKIWKEYLTKNNYTWENLRVIDTSKTLIRDYDVVSFPTYILVEDGGRIVKTFSSFAENQEYLGLE
ncbi:TlpA family protein disulfide reductase [Leeuwenhoekiella blandensis]|uniref:TlpA family protein disulfide reductase n=1 Tax=Leeuwenhoekiella blandensis TaxID=360293 RepID=UPI0009FEABD7